MMISDWMKPRDERTPIREIETTSVVSQRKVGVDIEIGVNQSRLSTSARNVQYCDESCQRRAAGTSVAAHGPSRFRRCRGQIWRFTGTEKQGVAESGEVWPTLFVPTVARVEIPLIADPMSMCELPDANELAIREREPGSSSSPPASCASY